MATVLYLVLDRETGEVHLRERRPSAAAGAGARRRPLPRGRAARCRSARSTRACSARRPATLPAGASLLLYTDGLVERRDEPLERRLDELAEAAGRAEGGLEGLCDARPRRACSASACRATTWRCWPCARGRSRASRSASRCPPSPSRCRGCGAASARFLHAAGADELETYEITLTVCEAAGNAIEHAYGPGDATLRRRGAAGRRTSSWRP